MEELRPNEKELLFLGLAYNRFYDIFNEVFDSNFWDKEPYYRLSMTRDAFSVYSELENYEPIKWVLDEMKSKRPPQEAEIAKELFKFIRNVLSHFPVFESWDDIWVNENLINWSKDDQSIDRFIKKNLSTGEFKYRFWEEKEKAMTYLSINYPSKYGKDRIYIKDIISEREGVKFSMILMRNILNSQVEGNKEHG